tara:strand:+ start:1233 stop:1460 length:228 start_codon:yes stop_codon:yes gene_type:complete
MIDPITKDKSKIYKQIELIVKSPETQSQHKVTYENSAMLISGNFIIIISLKEGHQEGDIYNLDKIKSYRTNLEKI